MRLLFVYSVVLFCLGAQAASIKAARPTTAAVMSNRPLHFKEWKSEKIQQVLNRIANLKTQMHPPAGSVIGAHVVQPVSISALKKSLAQEEWNLEIMKDLGVNDYFVLYLAPQNPSPERLLEIVKGLSQVEVADLMDAYSRSLYSSGSDKENATVRLPIQATERSGLTK